MAGVPEVNVGFNSAGLCVGSEISACESGYSNNKIQSGWFLRLPKRRFLAAHGGGVFHPRLHQYQRALR